MQKVRTNQFLFLRIVSDGGVRGTHHNRITIMFGSFSYPLRYIQCEHSGLPGCRAHLMDAATAEYVMFCDADDMFLSGLALYTILALAEKGFDALVCDFMEEVQNVNTRRSGFFPHKRKGAMTFALSCGVEIEI